MKLLLPLFLLLSSYCFSQTADFIQVKKNGKTIQTIFAGQDIAFTTTSGAYITAHINGIKHDSLFLQEYITQRLPTTIGTWITDTLGSYHYQFNYKQVAAMGKKEKKGFNLNETGGVLLTVASGVVYVADKEKFSAPLLLASAGLGAVGYLLLKTGDKPMVFGKKYTLEYMNMSGTKN
jgi:hypothetical protein